LVCPFLQFIIAVEKFKNQKSKIKNFLYAFNEKVKIQKSKVKSF